VALCFVSHPIGGEVDKLLSVKGRYCIFIKSINAFVPGGEDGAVDKVGVLSVGLVVEIAINVFGGRCRRREQA